MSVAISENIITDLENSDAYKKIKDFLLEPNNEKYTDMSIELDNSLSTLGNSYNNFRILITVTDGTVVYDSSKKNNSYDNFTHKLINENHNTRLSIIGALIKHSGKAWEFKYSTSTQKREYYVAHRVNSRLQVVSSSPNTFDVQTEALGVIRVSTY